jgi:hypothetical protein
MHTNQTPLTLIDKLKSNMQDQNIVERAKHEAQILQRISQLRRDGLWSIKRLPKLCEPKRTKTHWDYLLDEVLWMSTDFQQERKWKKATSKKISSAIQKYFKEKETKAELMEKEEAKRVRKNASFIAKEIMTFWRNVEKIVEYKQKALSDEKRKKEMDMHLNFIVDQTEKYSSWLMKSLAEGSDKAGQKTTRVDVELNVDENTTSDDNVSIQSDKLENFKKLYSSNNKTATDEDSDSDYDKNKDDDDDVDNESTIDSDDDVDKYDANEEIRQLQMESEMPIDDLLEVSLNLT